MGEEQSLARETFALTKKFRPAMTPEAWANDGGVETEVDFLVDRLHDLADEPSQDGSLH